jgi:hypothetical protein
MMDDRGEGRDKSIGKYHVKASREVSYEGDRSMSGEGSSGGVARRLWVRALCGSIGLGYDTACFFRGKAGLNNGIMKR